MLKSTARKQMIMDINPRGWQSRQEALGKEEVCTSLCWLTVTGSTLSSEIFSVLGSRVIPHRCLLTWQGETGTLPSLLALWFPCKATPPFFWTDGGHILLSRRHWEAGIPGWAAAHIYKIPEEPATIKRRCSTERGDMLRGYTSNKSKLNA